MEICQSLLVHFSIFRHLSCFQFLLIINNVAVKVHLNQYLLTLSFWGHYFRSISLKMNCLGKKVWIFCYLLPDCFLERLKEFCSIINNVFPETKLTLDCSPYYLFLVSLLGIQCHQSCFKVLWNNSLNALRNCIVGGLQSRPWDFYKCFCLA